MPLGVLTLTGKKMDNAGQALYADVVSLVGPASYTTGGDTGLEAALQALTKDSREILAVYDIALNGGYVSRYDYANKKLMHFTSNGAAPAALAQFTSAGNLAGTTFTLLVISR
jgi:hypothetical protein